MSLYLLIFHNICFHPPRVARCRASTGLAINRLPTASFGKDGGFSNCWTVPNYKPPPLMPRSAAATSRLKSASSRFMDSTVAW